MVRVTSLLTIAISSCLFVPLATTVADDAPVRKLLVIGVDGCRFDALRAAKTPNFDRLIADSLLIEPIRIFPTRYRGADTISGPGWSSILCGVWADKHGVTNNEFTAPNYDAYPHFFTRLKQARPSATTASFSDWDMIDKHITRDADVRRHFPTEVTGYDEADAQIAEVAASELRNGDTTAMFVYLGQVDETGHVHGFHPAVKEYTAAIERVDRFLGELLKAIAERESFPQEDWLILITSDHGGTGTGHGAGHDDPNVAVSFIIAHGSKMKRGTIEGDFGLVDVVPTGLTHLGIEIAPEWGLDGMALQSASLQSEATDDG